MKTIIKTIPGVKLLINTKVWKIFRHWTILQYGDRKNDTYTQFLRLPSQFEALSGPVLDFFMTKGPVEELKIVVIGCSNGAEAYSISSVLMSQQPHLRFKIYAYDIDREVVKRAKMGMFSREEIFDNKMINDGFINKTFSIKNSVYSVNNEIKSNVEFGIANALDPNLIDIVGAADILYAQNFLFHMNRKTAIRGFNNLYRILKSKAAVFIDGMDLGLRQKVTHENNLAPLQYKIEQIHNEARIARGGGWPYDYWGLEPFLTFKTNWERRYATIFLRTNN